MIINLFGILSNFFNIENKSQKTNTLFHAWSFCETHGKVVFKNKNDFFLFLENLYDNLLIMINIFFI